MEIHVSLPNHPMCSLGQLTASLHPLSRPFLFESGFSYFYKFVPSVPVRAFTVFAGPIPPELTADTLMTYMV